MPRKLTNKQLVVLRVLRDHGKELNAQAIADIITEQTPCAACDGREPEETTTRWKYQSHEHEEVCAKCYGRGTAYFSYSNAYQALLRLVSAGLVERRSTLDEWGDDTGRHVYRALPPPDADDPLERAWNLPAVER